MPSKIEPSFKDAAAGQRIDFKLAEAVKWALEPVNGAGEIGESDGIYVAPTAIPAQAIVRVIAKDATGKELDKARVRLMRDPDPKIVPSAVTLKAGQQQHFTIEPTVSASTATWRLPPGSPGQFTETHVYIAPDSIAAEQDLVVTASWDQIHCSAKIRLQSDKPIQTGLAVYWFGTMLTLLLTLVWLWPKLCTAGNETKSLRVLPAMVTLKPGAKQQFRVRMDALTNTADLAVLWSPPDLVSNNGVFTAQSNHTPNVLITATSVRYPQLSAHSTVYVSTNSQLTVQPEFISVSEGETVQFNASAPDRTETNSALLPLRWTVSPADGGSVSTNGVYEAPHRVSSAQLATVTVRSATDPAVVASALVQLNGPGSGCGAHTRFQLIFVLILGAVGSLIHAISSFVTYVGNRDFHPSWCLWYVFKPFQGAALALVVYLVAAAGLLKVESTGGLLAAGALAVMVGLFSEEATLKLRDIAGVLFGSRNDKRADKLDSKDQSQAAHITSVKPKEIEADAKSVELVISGTGFEKGCQVRVNGKDRPPGSFAANELELTLTAEDIKLAGTALKLAVVNPNKGPSNVEIVTIKPKP